MSLILSTYFRMLTFRLVILCYLIGIIKKMEIFLKSIMLQARSIVIALSKTLGIILGMCLGLVPKVRR